MTWYNSERLHSALDYVPPDEQEQAYRRNPDEASKPLDQQIADSTKLGSAHPTSDLTAAGLDPAQVATAQDSLGSALHVLSEPGEAGAAAVAQAQAAFTDGFTLVGALGAGVMLISVIVVFALTPKNLDVTKGHWHHRSHQLAPGSGSPGHAAREIQPHPEAGVPGHPTASPTRAARAAPSSPPANASETSPTGARPPNSWPPQPAT